MTNRRKANAANASVRFKLKREATATMTADTTVSWICLQDDWSTDGNDVETARYNETDRRSSHRYGCKRWTVTKVVTECHRTWDTQCECETAPAPANKGVRVTQLTGVTARLQLQQLVATDWTAPECERRTNTH